MYTNVISATWGRNYGKPVLKTTRYDGTSRILSINPLPFLAKTWVTADDFGKLDKTNVVKTDDTVTDITPFGKPTVKIMVASPDDLLKVRTDNPDILFYQADVKYGVDAFIETGMHLTKHLTPAFVDLEANPLVRVTDLIRQPLNPLISASITDIHGNTKFICENDEITFLNRYADYMRKFAYMLCWSSFDYSYPTLRARHLGVYNPFIFTEGIDAMRLFGRAVLKLDISRSKRTGFIRLIDAAKKLGIPFADSEAKNNINVLSQWYANDRLKLAEYNKADSIALWRICTELAIPETLQTILTDLNIFPTLYNETSQIFDMLRLRVAFNNKPRIVLPNRRRKPADYTIHNRTDKPAGGFVLDPIAGTYKNIFSFDSKNNYPRIIKALNIGLDTYDPEGTIRTEKLRFTNKRVALTVQTMHIFDELLKIYNAEWEACGRDEKNFKVYLKRFEIKHKLNSIYGQYGFITKPDDWGMVVADRLYDPDVLESVTLTGQAILKAATKFVES